MLSPDGVFPLKIELSDRVRRWMGSATSNAVSDPSHQPADLIARLRAADPAAIDEAYREHHAELRAFAQRVVGERAAAEDLVHDVFVALPEAVRGFRGEGTLRAFLIGVAANRCGRYVRSARRRRAAMAHLHAEFSTRPKSGEEDGERAELSERVQRALDRLPLLQRTALILSEVEERTAAEVAQILGIPEGTVRTRCFHARKKLLHLLRGQR